MIWCRRACVGAMVAMIGMRALGASYIESEGRATVDAVPNYVEFWFHVLRGAETLEAAAGMVANLEERVREVVQEHEIQPIEVEISPLAVPDVRLSEVQRTIRLRFSALNFTDPERGVTRFARFCDLLTTIAANEDWLLEGPVFGMNNRDEFEQLAVSNATKEAYPTAEGIAQVLRGTLTSVDSVVVLSIDWNRNPDKRFPLPNIRTVSCSAHVRVTYLFEAGPTQTR